MSRVSDRSVCRRQLRLRGAMVLAPVLSAKFISLVTLACLSLHARADSLSTTADTYISDAAAQIFGFELGDNSDTNFGASVILEARSQSDSPSGWISAVRGVRNTYSRFDISSLSFALEEMHTASLSLFAGAAGSIASGNVVGLYGLDESVDDWNESTLTWNNAPLNITNTKNGSPLATLTTPGSGTFNYGMNYEWEFDSTTALIDYLKNDADGIVTLVAQYQTDSVGSIFSVASKENTSGATAPTLTVIPEPASIAVCAAFILLLMTPRRYRSIRRA